MANARSMEEVGAAAARKPADGTVGGVVSECLIADAALTLGDADARLSHLLTDLDLPRRTAPHLCHRPPVV